MSRAHVVSLASVIGPLLYDRWSNTQCHNVFYFGRGRVNFTELRVLVLQLSGTGCLREGNWDHSWPQSSLTRL